MEPVLHYLVAKKSTYGVAHCLDLDIVATAEDGIGEAIRRLNVLVRCQYQGPFVNSSPKRAPQHYWDQFARSQFYSKCTVDLANPEIQILDPANGGILHVETKLATAA